jgi:membrane protein implicated in regulation of membrane protease activity
MGGLLQRMDSWHWWLIALSLGLLALLLRRRILAWPALAALLVGCLVYMQPGMFWYQQWLYFLLPSAVLAWLGRSRSGR